MQHQQTSSRSVESGAEWDPATLFPDAICPLCSQVFERERLFKHISDEHPRVRQNTIRVIQKYYPGWVEDHGACKACWNSYRDAGRVLTQMRGSRAGPVHRQSIG